MTKAPPKKTKEHRERVWSVRYNATENERLELLAADAGFQSTSTYIRNASLKEIFSRTDAKTIRQLMILGNNLNQLTRKAHADGFSTIEERILRLIDEIDNSVRCIGKKNDHKENSEA
ncbi:plasmid mobilization protein [Magnetovibrio sp.]|uniref:plasmid mobilization protein n=1 Tax=Magnetovibrio sp. TaxID=2024836 RepID=UPI002F9211DF